MVASFLFLACVGMAQVSNETAACATAGASGLLAGAILIGSGLSALAALAAGPARKGAATTWAQAPDPTGATYRNGHGS
jgi:hypothetical protein